MAVVTSCHVPFLMSFCPSIQYAVVGALIAPFILLRSVPALFRVVERKLGSCAAPLVRLPVMKNCGVDVVLALPMDILIYALLLYPVVSGRRYSPPALIACFPWVQRSVSP